MVDEEILDPSALSSVLITQTDLQLRELEIQRQIQLEKLGLERMQKEKLAMEKEKLAMDGERKIRNGRKREGERKTNSERKVRNGRTNSKRKNRTGRKRETI